jgi:hypothetical protein
METKENILAIGTIECIVSWSANLRSKSFILLVFSHDISNEFE